MAGFKAKIFTFLINRNLKKQTINLALMFFLYKKNSPKNLYYLFALKILKKKLQNNLE